MTPITTPVALGANSHSLSSSDLTVTLDTAIPSGALVFCFINMSRADSTNIVAPSTPSGGGVTWELESTVNYKTAGTVRASTFVYRAYATSPSGTSVTITPNQTCTMSANVVYTTGTVGGSNGASALVQEVTNTAGDNGFAGALAAAAMNTLTNTTDNGFLLFTAAGGAGAGSNIVPDSSPAMTELVETTGGAASAFTRSQVTYLIGTSATNPTLGSSLSAAGMQASGCVCYEIAAAQGPTITTQPTAQTALLSNGGTANFTAAATASSGNITGITVKKDGVTITDGGAYDITTTGVNSSPNATCTLVVTNTDTSLDGDAFTVDFTDANGTTTSSSAVRTGKNGPTLSGSGVTNGSGVATRTLVCDYVCGPGEFIALTATAKGRTVRGSARST